MTRSQEINNNVADMRCTPAIVDIRTIPGYEQVSQKAREYDRIFTAIEQDVVYKIFFETKGQFKAFCIDAYKNGLTPMELHKSLFGDKTEFADKSPEARVYSKIQSYFDGRAKHDSDTVVFTVDQITKDKLHQLFGQMKTIYDIIADYKIDGKISHTDFRNAKKGDAENPGFIKTLKQNKVFLADEFQEALAQALYADGVRNQKTFDKIQHTIEKSKAKTVAVDNNK